MWDDAVQPVIYKRVIPPAAAESHRIIALQKHPCSYQFEVLQLPDCQVSLGVLLA